jgi:rhomboid protease GluP
VPSPTAARFRALVTHFMSPTQSFRLHSYSDGEAQLRDERPGKPPVFIVIINGGKDDERSLRVRLTRLASENVADQHIVLVCNHSWMPEALKKIGQQFWPKMQLYQLTADAAIEVKPRRPLPALWAALKAQARTPPLALSEPEFAARCENAEAEKQRLADRYDEALLRRGTPFTFLLAALLAGLYGLARLWQSKGDSATVLVQLGARVGPFVRDGEWWRLLSSSLLHPGLIHLALDVLVVLSLVHQAEKLLGTAQLVALYTVSALAAGLGAMYAPGATALGLGVGAGGALWGVLAALAVLAARPVGLPVAVALRLRKIVGGSLLIGIVLTAMPSVERVAHLGGAAVGALLMLSGVLRPLRVGEEAVSAGRRLGQRVLGAAAALLLFGSLTVALLVGKPWQPDPTWKRRLGSAVTTPGRPGPAGEASGTGGAPSEAAAATNQAELAPVRRTLGEAGYSLVLPQGLGEARALTGAGKVPVFQFGDLGGQLQALDVVVQRQPRPLKKKGQLELAMEQSAALVRADKLRDGATELTAAAKTVLDGQPMWTLHLRLQESVQGRAAVLARRDAVIVLWYVYSDLLPENLQLDLARTLQSVKDEFAGFTAGAKKGKKGRRR